MEQIEDLLNELDMICTGAGEMRAVWYFARLYPMVDIAEVSNEINERMERVRKIKNEILDLVEHGDW